MSSVLIMLINVPINTVTNGLGEGEKGRDAYCFVDEDFVKVSAGCEEPELKRGLVSSPVLTRLQAALPPLCLCC